MRRVAAALAILLTTACSTAPAEFRRAELHLNGKAVLNAAELQEQAEAELGYILDFGYVARAGAKPVSCWFARAGGSEIDQRLWCGPVQVPGTGATADWVPVPLKEIEQTTEGVRLEVQPPQVPSAGSRSTPLGKLVRFDGTETDPAKASPPIAGADFLAVLPDDGQRSNADLGLGNIEVKLRDDLLAVSASGWANPDTWETPDGTLRAAPGSRLRVVRLHVEKLNETDSGFQRTAWQGWAPQPSELALEVPGKRHVLPMDRLPANGFVLVAYTVPDPAEESAKLALTTVGAKSLEQRVEVPTGARIGDVPTVLLRGFSSGANAEQKVTVGGQEFGMKVAGVRLGRQRPVKTGESRYDVVTATGPDKALLEIRLEATGSAPESAAGFFTKDLIAVTLPDGSKAPQVGVRYDGGVLPFAVVVEVPADVRTVSLGLTAGSLDLPGLGKTSLAPVGAAVSIPLDL